MTGISWVIVDTETDGLYDPIHVVELSAQRMNGWVPDGEPFQMFLNHDVPIPEAAVAIHGYTEAFLSKYGKNPVEVHEAFRSYVGNAPIVAHNLSYDWNRCLEREWVRLGIPQIGQRGFCAMMLARRLVSETQNYRLETLKQHFKLSQTQSHRALNDVMTVVELFGKVYRSRLEPAGLTTFVDVAAFSRRTPVAKCLDTVRRRQSATPLVTEPIDAWYYIDSNQVDHGPFTASEIDMLADSDAYYVWRQGMDDWVTNLQCAEFIALTLSTSSKQSHRSRSGSDKSLDDLLELCRGILADGKVTTAEVISLNNWLQDVGFINEWPASKIAATLESILEDGVVTEDEKEELKALLGSVVSTSDQIQTDEAPTTPTVIEQQPACVCRLVELVQGSREWLEWRHNGIGASDAPVIMGENPWKSVDELLSEKRARPKPSVQNEAMARGTLLEPEARKRYIEKTGIRVLPACFQNMEYDWMRASLDGISEDGTKAVEIKCGESVYRKTATTGVVPDYYYGQLQHILAVTGLPAIDFWCYLPDRPPQHISVLRDDRYIARLIAAESAFWSKVQNVSGKPLCQNSAQNSLIKTSPLELQCVGNAGSGGINANCWVVWHDVSVDHDKKHVTVTSRWLQIQSFTRENRVNTCRFEVPEGYICWYRRYISTKPQTWEQKWFRVNDGQINILADRQAGDFASLFLREYVAAGYSCDIHGENHQ